MQAFSSPASIIINIVIIKLLKLLKIIINIAGIFFTCLFIIIWPGSMLSFEVKMEVRFIPNDEAVGGGLKPDIKKSVALKVNKDDKAEKGEKGEAKRDRKPKPPEPADRPIQP